MEINTVVFDGYVEEAAQALIRITPYTIEEARAIVLAIAQYEAADEVTRLLTYAGKGDGNTAHG